MQMTSLASVMEAGPDKLPSTQDPKKIREAAQQFESLLIGQLLKSAHDASSGDSALGGDQAGGSLLDLGEQHFAQLLAQNGGFGMAKLIEQGLRKKAADVSK